VPGVSGVSIEVVDDPAGACAAVLGEVAVGGGQIVVAGGSTPRAAYETVRKDGWDRAVLWFGDERCVPADDDRSNYRMVLETLLDPIRAAGGGEPVVHRMGGELGPAAGADAYEALLDGAGRPAFDLVLLGLGPDGHTLSLFPGQPAVSDRSRWVLGIEQAGLEPFVSRVTLTLAALQAARRVMFLVSGAAKADAVAAAFGPGAKPDPQIPASLVPGIANDVVVLLDSAAAAKL
jgi:6-phosphogluconolactonase